MVSSEGAALEEKLNPKPDSQVTVFYGSNPPSNPKKGDFWYNTDENRLYQYN